MQSPRILSLCAFQLSVSHVFQLWCQGSYAHWQITCLLDCFKRLRDRFELRSISATQFQSLHLNNSYLKSIDSYLKSMLKTELSLIHMQSVLDSGPFKHLNRWRQVQGGATKIGSCNRLACWSCAARLRVVRLDSLCFL